MSTSKFLAVGLASALAAFSLVGCGESRHDVEEAYYFVVSNVKVPYWQAARAGFEAAGDLLKVKYEMVGPDSYDPQAQREEFRRILSQRKPTGILVSAADPEIMRAEIDQAIDRGIPVITIDSDAPKSKRLLFIGTDNYDAGRMGAQIAVKRMGGKGNVVIFTMPEQANLKERLQGYQEIFDTHSGIKIIETVDIKGDPRIAFDRMMELTEKGKVSADAFICLEALACPEVADVLSRNKVEGKTVVAMDTDPRTLEWIQKGMIAATIAQKPYTMAYFGLRVLDNLHHYKLPALGANLAQDTRAPLPSFVDTGATLIDQNNVAEFMKTQ
jgi:ribose transport system substrate-binding protein